MISPKEISKKAYLSEWCVTVWVLPDGNPHREDGPAVSWDDGSHYWYINGKCHRLDGPAFITEDGDEEWYFNDMIASHDFYPWAYELGIDLKNLSEDDKSLITIKWGDYGK